MHRSLLRVQSRHGAILREYFPREDAEPALAHALTLANEAAAELAAIPDSPELRAADDARLAAAEDDAGDGARGHDGPDPRVELREKFDRLVQGYRDGKPFDRAHSAPVQVLACCLVRNAGAG